MFFDPRPPLIRLLCFLVACLLLFYCVVIPAYAEAVSVAVSASLVGLSPFAAVAGVLTCLGIGYVAGGTFADLVNDILSAMPTDFFITVNSKNLIEGISYNHLTYVSETIVKWILNYIYNYSTPVLVPTITLSGSYADLFDRISEQSWYRAQVEPYLHDFTGCYCLTFSSGLVYAIYSDNKVIYRNATTSSGVPTGYIKCTAPALFLYGTDTALSGYLDDSSNTYSNVGGTEEAGWGPITDFVTLSATYTASTYDVNIYAEAAPDLDDDEEYQAWKARRLFRVIEGAGGDEDPDDDDDDGLKVLLPYYPVPAAENCENLPDTLEQAWAGSRSEDPADDPVSESVGIAQLDSSSNLDTGSGSETDPDTGTDTDTNAGFFSSVLSWLQKLWEALLDILAAIKDLALAIVDPIVQAIADVVTAIKNLVPDPPSFGDLQIPGLRDFFPFCIPFDLLDMMRALSASPVAPVFVYACPMPDGSIEEVTIDLSAWNGVAATIRSVIVAIYVVTLANSTRKFIKW